MDAPSRYEISVFIPFELILPDSEVSSSRIASGGFQLLRPRHSASYSSPWLKNVPLVRRPCKRFVKPTWGTGWDCLVR
jgi:hypothetical protein